MKTSWSQPSSKGNSGGSAVVPRKVRDSRSCSWNSYYCEEVPAEVVTSTEEQVSEVIEQPAVEEPTKVETPAAEVTEPAKVETTPAVETQRSTVDYKAARMRKWWLRLKQAVKPSKWIIQMRLFSSFTDGVTTHVTCSPSSYFWCWIKQVLQNRILGYCSMFMQRNPEAIKR